MADKYCLNCGSRIPEGLKYCPVCGNPVQNKETKQNETLNPWSMPVPETDLENEPVPVQENKNSKTQKLDLNSIRRSDPVIPAQKEEKTKIAPDSEPVFTDDISKEKQKPKHGRLYNTFIEDDDDFEEELEEEQPKKERHRSHPVLITILIILIILIAAFIYIYLRRPELLSRFMKTDSAETTPSVEPTETPVSTPEITPTPEITEEPVIENASIGTVQIETDVINVRSQPDANADTMGTVSYGETYDVFETVSDGELTWYRIGDSQWIADGGGWVTYTAQ